jgi:hypothetical protein
MSLLLEIKSTKNKKRPVSFLEPLDARRTALPRSLLTTGVSSHLAVANGANVPQGIRLLSPLQG